MIQQIQCNPYFEETQHGRTVILLLWDLKKSRKFCQSLSSEIILSKHKLSAKDFCDVLSWYWEERVFHGYCTSLLWEHATEHNLGTHFHFPWKGKQPFFFNPLSYRYLASSHNFFDAWVQPVLFFFLLLKTHVVLFFCMHWWVYA